MRKKFLKLTTLLHTRNSKNSKRILFIVPELYWPCPKACVLYLLPQFNFVAVAYGAYYIICQIFLDHCISHLMYFELVYTL